MASIRGTIDTDGPQTASTRDRDIARIRDESSLAVGALAVGLTELATRTTRVGGLVAALRDRGARGLLTGAVPELSQSYVHMHVNRLLRAEHRLHELVIYDFLARDAQERRAREQQGCRRADRSGRQPVA